MQTPSGLRTTEFSIDGANVIDMVRYGSITYEDYANGRKVLKFILDDPHQLFTVNGEEEVIYDIDSVRQYRGIIWTYEMGQMPDLPDSRCWSITCVDMSYVMDAALINGVYGPGTLSELLTIVLANAFDGVTLDPSQADYGIDPQLGVQTWEFLTLRQVVDRLAVDTGRLWRIDPTTLWFSMQEPYANTTPRNFDEDDAVNGSGIVAGSIQISKDFSRKVNAVWLRYGPSAPALVTERFDGNGVAATFAFNYTWLQNNSYNTLTYFDGVNTGTQTISVLPDTSALWHVNQSTGTLTRAAGAIPVGGYVEIQYLANFPVYREFRDPVDYAIHGPRSLVVSDPGILTPGEAASIGNALLRRDGGPYRQVKFRTLFGHGFTTLQAVTLNLPSLDIDNIPFFVTEVHMREVAQRNDEEGLDVAVTYYEWEITCYEGLTIYDWLDELRGDPLPRGSSSVPLQLSTPALEYVEEGLSGYPAGGVGASVSIPAGSAWTNGSWVEVMGAAAAPSTQWALAGLLVADLPSVGEVEIDVALGAAQDFTAGTFRIGGNTPQSTNHIWFPITFGPIAAGVPVSVRARSRAEVGGASLTATLDVKVLYYTTVPTHITLTSQVLRVWPSSSQAVVALPASSWTNGAYTQITAATGDIWSIAAILGTEADVIGARLIELDVAVGAASAEQPITTHQLYTGTGPVRIAHNVLDPILVGAILPGVRVAIRGRSSSAVGANFNVAIQYYEGTL